jgi:hypothetical protein
MSVTNGNATVASTLIAQLRSNAPVFGGRVAGAAEYQRGLRDYNTSLPLPAAYVLLPLAQEAEPNDSFGGLFQIVHVHFGVAVELDAQRDRRGQAPMMDLEAIWAEVNASILNLYIDDCHFVPKGVYVTGGRFLEGLDRARVFYQFEYGYDWQITDADGVQPIAIPLVSVELDGFHSPGAIGVPGSFPAFVAVVNTEGGTPPPPTDGPWPATLLHRFGRVFGIKR